MLDDPLPAGLEAVDLSLLTAGGIPGPGAADSTAREGDEDSGDEPRWAYGSWDGGWWSPFDYKELRDDRVVYVATRALEGELHRDLPRSGYHARDVRQTAGTWRGDVQSGGVRGERRRHVSR